MSQDLFSKYKTLDFSTQNLCFQICETNLLILLRLFFIFILCVLFLGEGEGELRGAIVPGKLPVPGRSTDLDNSNSRSRADCSCSECNWGLLFSFFFRLSF